MLHWVLVKGFKLSYHNNTNNSSNHKKETLYQLLQIPIMVTSVKTPLTRIQFLVFRVWVLQGFLEPWDGVRIKAFFWLLKECTSPVKLTLRVQVPNNHLLSQIVTYITTIRNLST